MTPQQPLSLIVWYRRLGTPPPCLELDAWPWLWVPSWGWTEIHGSVRAACDKLAARIRRGKPGEYLLTPDDIPFTPPDSWPEPGSPWPLIVLRPKPRRPLSGKRLAAQQASFAKLESRQASGDTSTLPEPSSTLALK